MATQSEKLKEILALIQNEFEAKAIDENDLNEIIFFTSGHNRKIKNENILFSQTYSKIFLDDFNISDLDEPITSLSAQKIKESYSDFFSNNPKLSEKVFRFRSKLIIDLLNQKSNLVVYFSQDQYGNLCIILNSDSNIYEITESSVNEITENTQITKLNLFKGNLKSTIENSLGKGFTEYVVIPFISNFDQFQGVFPHTIALVPGIAVGTNDGRMTLVMHFEDQYGKTVIVNKRDTYYDTFTPHP